MTTKKKAKAKKVVVKKVAKIAPEVHVVELEVHGAPDPPIPLPLIDPLELEFNDFSAGPVKEEPETGVWGWLKSLW